MENSIIQKEKGSGYELCLAKRLLVFIGDSASGKTTLVTELASRFPAHFKKVITYTSRRKRKNEIHGRDYHFMPNRNFFSNNQELVLVKYSKHGTCYGTRKQDLYSCSHHLLLTSKPSGIPKLIKLGFHNLIVIRIHIDENLKIARMRNRGDSEEEIATRLQLDSSSPEIDLKNTVTIDMDAKLTTHQQIAIILGHMKLIDYVY